MEPVVEPMNGKHGFASLQYYDPHISKEKGANQLRIPIETFDLDEKASHAHSAVQNQAENTPSLLKTILYNLFSHGNSSAGKKEPIIKIQQQTATKKNTDYDLDSLVDDEEDAFEASENLPFSAVRHIIPLDGCGLACDFGNFIKLVQLDKPSLTEKERLKQTRDALENRQAAKQMEEVVEEDDSGCQCDEDEGCSSLTKGVDGCCGGANKEQNGGKCCGGNVKQQQEEKRRQRLLSNKKTVVTPASCGGVSIADCSLRNNCSRASDCASHSATASSTYSFNNWL